MTGIEGEGCLFDYGAVSTIFSSAVTGQCVVNRILFEKSIVRIGHRKT